MRAIEPAPNLLLVGGPKCGTTSLLFWLRKHKEVYHPWGRINSGAIESGFLLGGVVESPYNLSKPRGTLFLPHEADMDYFRGEKMVIDKSPQHLYSKRALETVRDLMPEARVIITLRDPYDLLISLFHQMKKTVEFNTSFESLISKLDRQNWVADNEDPETWGFLTYPRFSSHVKKWVDELGPDRVRVITLSSIASNPRYVLDQIGNWLDIDEKEMPRNLSVKNPRGELSKSRLRKFLRSPPDWAFSLAKVIFPTRSLRKALLDPIRSRGWKYVPSEKQPIPDETSEKIRLNLGEDIEFFENLEKHIPKSVII